MHGWASKSFLSPTKRFWSRIAERRSRHTLSISRRIARGKLGRPHIAVFSHSTHTRSVPRSSMKFWRARSYENRYSWPLDYLFLGKWARDDVPQFDARARSPGTWRALPRTRSAVVCAKSRPATAALRAHRAV